MIVCKLNGNYFNWDNLKWECSNGCNIIDGLQIGIDRDGMVLIAKCELNRIC